MLREVSLAEATLRIADGKVCRHFCRDKCGVPAQVTCRASVLYPPSPEPRSRDIEVLDLFRSLRLCFFDRLRGETITWKKGIDRKSVV